MKVSVSRNKSEKHGNFTYGFKVEEIRAYSELAGVGFAPCEFKEEHRKNENVVGLGELGYIDLDDSVGGDKELVGWCRKRGFGLARSGSNRAGRYRIVYKRDQLIERGASVVSWWGFEALRFFEGEQSSVVGFILEQELKWFQRELPEGFVESVDVTSARASMHSKEIGEMLVDKELEELGVLPAEIYDYSKVKYRDTAGKAGVVKVCEYGQELEISVKIKEGKEILLVRTGNVFEGKVSGSGRVEKVTIGEALRLKCQLRDPIAESGLNPERRCGDDDAYMPFTLRLNTEEDTLFCAAFGQHDRNHETKSRILIVFREGSQQEREESDMDFWSVVDWNGSEFVLDEKNRKFWRTQAQKNEN